MNNRGLSLIEIIVALGISGIVVVSSLTIWQDIVTQQATAQSGHDLTELLYETNNILNNERLCRAAVAGTPSENGQEISLSSAIRRNGTFGKLDVQSVTIHNIVNLGGINRTAEVTIRGTSRANVYGSKDFIESTKIYYSVDANNNILNCISTAVSAEDTCRALGGTWDGSNCNFCRVLGGTLLADGTCQLQGATVYGWQPMAWSECTGGTRTRVVECRDLMTSTVVPDANCTTPRLPASETCEVFDWRIGAWSECSGGQQTRTVTCADTFTGRPALSDANCTSPKPPETQACAMDCQLAAGTPWSASGVTCNATSAVTIPLGTSVTVTDTTAPTTGSATFSCDANGYLSPPMGATCQSELVLVQVRMESCFVAGTPVTMADGSTLSIEDIQVGDLVKTYDELLGVTTVSRVGEIFHHEEKEETLFTFHLANGRRLTSNDAHPFYLPAEKRYRRAKDVYRRFMSGLDIEFMDENHQPVTVVDITSRKKKVKLYNLHVESPYDTPADKTSFGHNYFAGGVLVHNLKDHCDIYVDYCDNFCVSGYRVTMVGGCPGVRCYIEASRMAEFQQCENNRPASYNY